MKIAFAGHSHIHFGGIVKEIVKKQLQKNIANAKSVTFYLGGYGAFDEICAHACRELKKENANIHLIYVTPYITPAEQEKIKIMQKSGLYDASIYPPIEGTPPRFAILKRNEWMMSNADLIIAYVNRSFGGAYQSLQAAKRQNKPIINICDILGNAPQNGQRT